MLVEQSELFLLAKVFKTTLLFFVSLPFIPALAFIAVVFWAYRISAIFIVWLFTPYLVSIVSPSDTLFSVEARKSFRETVTAIPGVIVVDGKVDVHQVRDWFMSHVIFVRKPDGSIKYSRFRQIQVPFCGLLWWKWDPSFHIDNHIREYRPSSDSNCGREDLADILTKFANAHMSSNRPAWDIAVLNNYETYVSSNENAKCSEKTAIFYRISHSYCDGHSVLELMGSTMKSHLEMSMVNPYNINTSARNPQDGASSTLLNHFTRARTFRTTLGEKLIFLLYLCVTFPYYMICVIQKNRTHRHTTGVDKLLPRNQEVSQRLFFVLSESFSTERIEDFTRRSGVSLQTLVLSFIAHGYSKSKLLNNEIVPFDDIKVTVNFPGPIDSENSTLCNNWMETYYNVQLRQQPSLQNLMKIQKDVSATNFSPLLLSNYWFTWLLHYLPISILTRISTREISHINMSFLTGPLNNITVAGYTINELLQCASIPSTTSGLGATVFTYNDSSRILFAADLSRCVDSHSAHSAVSELCKQVTYNVNCIIDNKL